MAISWPSRVVYNCGLVARPGGSLYYLGALDVSDPAWWWWR